MYTQTTPRSPTTLQNKGDVFQRRRYGFNNIYTSDTSDTSYALKDTHGIAHIAPHIADIEQGSHLNSKGAFRVGAGALLVAFRVGLKTAKVVLILLAAFLAIVAVGKVSVDVAALFNRKA